MTENVKKLYRSTSDRMIAGICGGLGEYFGIDSTLVRLLFVFGAIFTGSVLFWAYIIMLIIVPEEPAASKDILDVSSQEQTEEHLEESPAKEIDNE